MGVAEVLAIVVVLGTIYALKMYIDGCDDDSYDFMFN